MTEQPRKKAKLNDEEKLKPDLIEDIDNDEDEHVEQSVSTRKIVKGEECPYLDTISRQKLDFDFEKCCSVSLSRVNVYVCLTCGKYFQGRGKSTHAYTHSLEQEHHMFMKLQNGKVYCLPDNYEVIDRSLDDIRHVLRPVFTDKELATLDTDVKWKRAIDGSHYMPGLIGLNNLKNTDYVNVVIQTLARITPIRNFFLKPSNYSNCDSELVQAYGQLMLRLWNTRNFKGQASPHEFMQAVLKASNKRFSIDVQGDPVDFMTWLLNSLHLGLTGGKRKKSSIITSNFQGELEITVVGANNGETEQKKPQKVPFLLLGLDLPPMPLFKDILEKNIIPQVPIQQLLQKYNGQNIIDDIKLGRRSFKVTKLPPYLIFHTKRFLKTQFIKEKNATIVAFPIKGLNVSRILNKEDSSSEKIYDLITSVSHEGDSDAGFYKSYIYRKSEQLWYEVHDLEVKDEHVIPEMVALSEILLQVYELRT